LNLCILSAFTIDFLQLLVILLYKVPITNLSTEFIVSSKQVYVLDDTVIVCLKNSYA